MIINLVLILLSAGCQQKYDSATLPPSGLAGTTVSSPAPQGVLESKRFSGVAKEVIAEQGISYVRLEVDGSAQIKWVALVNVNATVGQRISVDGEIEMKNFFSKGLNRRFASITFGKITSR